MIKIQKAKKNNKNWIKFRLIFVGIIATTIFIVLSVRLAVIQFVEGEKLSKKAYNQQVTNQMINPNRGTIYDAKGDILAQSIPVDTISINPRKVKYYDGTDVEKEVIAEGISNIFNMSYDELLEKLNSNRSVIVLGKKVEQDIVKELKDWMSSKRITAGINFDGDAKRYYPYDDLASNLIGFCGTDNNGQTGLEQRWNDVLTGTAGKIVTTTDVHGQAISDEYEQYIATENGSNLYLTIDTNIQAIAEKYLEQAMIKNTTATSGNVLIMNPQTGDILAMASNPDYNLNDPSNYIPTGYAEEEWNNLEKTDKSNALLQLWQNKVVSGVYEPGSTFKLITSSVGLEEGFVQTNTPNDFFCSHVYKVLDEEISCWRAEPHGSQTLEEALCNSCNPAFMQLGQRIGAKILYKYFDAFGLFDAVGDDISKAYPGKFYDLDKIGQVELATTSFGQRFTISPLQLVTAVSAICNDGVLVKPKIVKQIENTDTGSIEVIETKKIRQVISKSTADKVKKMMQSVVKNGTGWRADVPGYSIGGKSGTSEPISSKKEEGYVASFIAISPIENTQVVVLVALYGLQEQAEHQGGAVAGPVAAQILSEILPYLNIASDNIQEKVVQEEKKLISVPNVKDLTVNEATNKLQSLGFNVIANTPEDPNIALVTEQMPKYGIGLSENSIIYLYTASETERVKVKVPNVEGMSVEQATSILSQNNLNIQITGTSGIVVSQEPINETEVDAGTAINVVIKEQLVGAQ